MFDVGFSELLVIGIVALIVIGPEKLPSVARTLGHLAGRAQRYVNDVKADIHREVQLEELQRLQAQVTESARQLEASVKSQLGDAQAQLEAVAESVQTEVASAQDSVALAAPHEAETPAAPKVELAAANTVPGVGQSS